MDMNSVDRAFGRFRARREKVLQDIAEICGMLAPHIDDHDLECYHLGMVEDEAELAKLEEYLLWCETCVDRAEAAAAYVDEIRVACCEREHWTDNPNIRGT